MKLLIDIFGEGKDLSVWQMCARAMVIYFIALLLIRISGRRTFGRKSAFDNTIVIILGAVLSRAVVGASEFVPTVASSLCMAVLHRLLAWAGMYNGKIARFLHGKPLRLFQSGDFNYSNMRSGLIAREEVMEGVRLKINKDDLDSVDEIIMETTGEISVLKKEMR